MPLTSIFFIQWPTCHLHLDILQSSLTLLFPWTTYVRTCQLRPSKCNQNLPTSPPPQATPWSCRLHLQPEHVKEKGEKPPFSSLHGFPAPLFPHSVLHRITRRVLIKPKSDELLPLLKPSHGSHIIGVKAKALTVAFIAKLAATTPPPLPLGPCLPLLSSVLTAAMLAFVIQ